MSAKTQEKSTTKEKKVLLPIIIILSIVAIIIAGITAFYVHERNKYSHTFLPNTSLLKTPGTTIWTHK